MLRERLVRFLSLPEIRTLPDGAHREIVRALLLYSLGRRNSEQLRQLSLRYRATDAIYQFKSQHLDRTHYVASLYWRVVFEYFRNLKTRTADGPGSVQMVPSVLIGAIEKVRTIDTALVGQECARDVMLLERFLDLDDHRQLYRIARATDYRTPTRHDLLPVIRKLQRYCTTLVRRRMRFILKHDRSMTSHDLETALFEAGLITLHQFDADDNELRLLNTAKRGAHNYFVRLVEYHTAQCRARLVRKTSGATIPYDRRACGTCAWFDVAAPDGKTCRDAGHRPAAEPCRRKGLVYHVRAISEAHQCGNCLHYDRPGPFDPERSCLDMNVEPTQRPCRNFDLRVGSEQFVTTTASIDAPVRPDRDDHTTLADFIPAKQTEDEQAWLDGLCDNLTDVEARVVRITLGIDDEGFDRWLYGRTYQHARDLKDQQLARYACEFLGLDLDDMRDVLRQHLVVAGRYGSGSR